MVPSRIISADSHMLEPPDLWTTRLDRKFRDQAPHVEDNEKGSYFVAPGLKPSPVSLGFGAGRSGQELKDHFKKGFNTAPPGGWDPVERVKDQDIDGVMRRNPLYHLRYAAIQSARPRIAARLLQSLQRLAGGVLLAQSQAVLWNRVGLAGRHRRRHQGAASMRPNRAAGRADLGRAAGGSALSGAGFGILCGAPPRNYGCRLSLHIGTGKREGRSRAVLAPRRAAGPRGPFMTSNYMNGVYEIQRSFTDIIFGGVLKRFPKSDSGIGGK